MEVEFELDNDGYPEEATLSAIAYWTHEQGYGVLLAKIKEIWKWDDYFTGPTMGSRKIAADRGKFFYHLSTGGWSGNEDIIGALRRNTLFWITCWESSKRGGHYEFSIRVEDAQSK